MNKLIKSNLIKAVKENISQKTTHELLDWIETFRYHWQNGIDGENKRDLLIDQTLYLIELDRRTQNGTQ